MRPADENQAPLANGAIPVPFTTATKRRPFPRPEQLAHRARAKGGMKAFLALARSLQRLRS